MLISNSSSANRRKIAGQTPIHLYLKLAVVTLGLGLFVSAQAPYRSVIKGIVVDKYGRPVGDADVTFNNPSSGRIPGCGSEHPWGHTNIRGEFTHEAVCTVPNRTASLLITKDLYSGRRVAPLSVQLWDALRERDPRFAGLPIQLTGNETLDLGELPVQVFYNPVDILVLDPDSQPHFHTLSDWSSVVLIVRDPKGVAVGGEGLSTFDRENSVQVARGALLVALPAGTWTLELLKSWSEFTQKGETRSYLARTTISVTDNDNPKVIQMVVSPRHRKKTSKHRDNP
jgi:hypothetical protein